MMFKSQFVCRAIIPRWKSALYWLMPWKWQRIAPGVYWLKK